MQRTKYRAFLIGTLPEAVRFEGRYAFNSEGTLESGPGFVALPPRSRAPYDMAHGKQLTRVVIPISGGDTPRAGSLTVLPYTAGSLPIDWTVVALQRDCETKGQLTVKTATVTRLGPFDVAAGAPQIVVQDFVTPDPRQEIAAPDGAQRLLEVETSADGRYRLDIFPRRYRVFERATGAKLVERSGVKPRFSPDGRFVVASTGDADLQYPTHMEVIDLAAGRAVAQVEGPIVAWSNGDALMLAGSRAYQTLNLFNTLVDPVIDNDGVTASWLTFSPGCGTCDAWASSNLRIDWDQLAVLRGDSGEPRAMGIAVLSEGRKVETTSFGDDEAVPLHTRLRQIYGQPNITLAKGWSGNAPLKITHPGRGYNGYTDDDASLTPDEKGRPSQMQFLAPRRLALADGKVLKAADLLPAGSARDAGDGSPAASEAAAPGALDKGYVADELSKLGLVLTAADPIPEQDIPKPADWETPVIRPWPEALQAEILAANAELKGWFPSEDEKRIVVGAWRLRGDGGETLLVQHGLPAMTINGPHELHFDTLVLGGPLRGQTREIESIGGLFSQYVGRQHTLARIFALSASRIVVALASTGKAAVLDLKDHRVPPQNIELVEPTLLCSFYEDTSRGLLVQGNCDGQLFVFNPAKQATPIVSGRVVDGEILLYAPQGYYAATFEGAHFVHVSFPGLPGVHSFEQFASALEKPEAIKALITGNAFKVSPVAISPPPSLDAWPRLAGTTNAPSAIDIKTSAVNGLAMVEIYEDGSLSRRQPATGRGASLTLELSRRPHVRTASVVAIDSLGFRSRPATVTLPAAPPSARTNTLHVVAVGVDAYDKLAKLSGARADAEALIGALKSTTGYYHDVKVTLRTDAAATPDVVRADIAAAVANATANDTILVFFAGHGGLSDDGRYFMATSATDESRLAETAIDWQETARLLGTAKARVIAVIDACHSGQTGLVTPTNDGAVASLATTTSAPMVVLAASKGRQISEEMPNGGGGVFTQSLARIIASERAAADTNRDGVLSVSELYRSLKAAVEAQTSGRQTPWLVRRNLAGDPPLL